MTSVRRLVGNSLRRVGWYDWCYDRLIDLGTYPANRAYYSRKYLSGSGLEIGALHNPLPVADGVRVTYVDRLEPEELMNRYPELDPKSIDRSIVVDDGFVLDTVALESQDFVIANHVLEHSMDPLHTLANWHRVLKPGGVIYVTIPVAEYCFDKGRPITTVEHMLKDYELAESEDRETLHERNREHYREWVDYSEVALRREAGAETDLDDEQRAANAVNLWQHREEIHFHTFTPASFRELLTCFCSRIRPGCELLASDDFGVEVVAILGR